ncbi:hypothetical protein FVEG_05553 [Fusarium verticillioides 7600]|uniref:Transcription factor hoxa13 n=1 Tax=Gibberella moniliformis (strain M3125 / FGSC 7600) TaxID=334819 RepID=W7MI78_GIBM7|nr:hypothetical protein FVEG_05553 [Fusarium verticillioides 7600]XP_018750708.1 hypothetical protein FVEG_05553 [Fusarium verticillioides 7600]EWG44516.1 hypothetical protein FVEG_05553 [Fusarium verticillioides 7600]EWG44517.1 hypothetical protein FVEG_05553 [Fusarium verticillioides 7600]
MAESAGSIMNGNGHINGKANGKPVAGRRASIKKRRSIFAWTFSVVARLATWFAIYTVLFRCPPSLEQCDENTPSICKPYFQVKNTVQPHVQPYYDHYAAPYVEIARPYYDTVDSKVWQPTRAYAVQYGAPWVEKAQAHTQALWEKNGQPQLVKYQALVRAHYDQSVGPYVNQAGEKLGPYYDIARTNGLQMYYEYLQPGYEFVHPYAIRGYDVASDFTTKTALPTAYWTWNKTYTFLDSNVWPHVRAVYVQNVEPQLVRIGERLGRYKTKTTKPIQESYSSSYTTGTTASSFQKPAPQSTSSVQTSSSQAPVATESPLPEVESASPDYINPVQAPPPTENESEKRRKAREMVAQDLETWQTKFATQADEGATDLEERVDEIAKRMIEENVNINGQKLFDDLETTIDRELTGLRNKIVELAGTNADGADVNQQIVTAVRSSGMAIKQKAQAIRQWRQSYDQELQETVVTVADVHFQVLDETRNLALQQIGMRWAWTDGITYKDWAKYHELKRTLNEWTEQLKQLIVTHPALLEAQDAAARVEDEGMEIASVAAKELARLKDIARYKVAAGDTSDNFDIEALKLAAEQVAAAKQAEAQTPVEDDSAASSLSEVVEEATSQAEEAEQNLEDFVASIAEPIEEEASEVAESASESVSSASSVFDEPNIIEKATSAVSSSAESIASDASSLIFEGEESASSIAKEASETVESLSSTASESAAPVIGEASSELSEVVESATNVAKSEDSISNGSEEPLEAGDKEPLVEIEEDPLTHRDETPLSEQHEHVKPAFLGAAAQEVPHRQIVLDDYVDTDAIASATDAAQSVYSNAVSRASEQYSSALSVVSAQIYGTPKPVHEQLLSSVSSSYDQAVSAAGDQFDKAKQAATTAAQQLPTTTTVPTWLDWERIESIASQRLNEGRLWAEIQYQSALIAAGLATPTPSSAPEKYYEQAKMNYYAGLGAAQDRYSRFLAGASSALSSLTATPTPTDLAGSASSVASVARESAASAAQAAGEAAGSASSVASVARESAASAAQAAGEAAGSVYSAAGDTVKSAAQVVDDSISSVVDAANEQISAAGLAIGDSWNNIVEQISGQVYGEPTQIAWYEHVWGDASSYAAKATDAAADKASIASEAAAASAVTASAEALRQYESVSELVSELISGKEPSFTESVLARFQRAYATAAANAESLRSQANEAAASAADKVGSAASEATEAVKETFQRAKDEL